MGVGGVDTVQCYVFCVTYLLTLYWSRLLYVQSQGIGK